MSPIINSQTVSSKVRFPIKQDFSAYLDKRYSSFSNNRENSSKSRKATLIILIVTIGAIFFFWIKSGLKTFLDNIIKPYSFEIIFNSQENHQNKYQSKEEVLLEIKNLLDEQKGNYSLYVYSFNKKEDYGIDENKIFSAASVNKVPIMLAFYKEIEKGNFSLKDKYQLKEEDIQDYGSGSMRYDEPGKTYSYDELLTLAGKKSDNTAAHVMYLILVSKNIQKFIAALGLTKTSIDQNLTTPKEAGQLFVKLYNKEILKNKENISDFFNKLTKTDYEDRIPKGVPESVVVAHKIGNEERIYHDCGIVFGKDPYVICIFSEEAPEDEALSIIPQISKIIWNYENQ